MRTIRINPKEYSTLCKLSKENSHGYDAVFSTNKKITWPKATQGLTPHAKRTDVSEYSTIFLKIEEAMLDYRGKPGRFFINTNGVYYKENDVLKTEVQFIQWDSGNKALKTPNTNPFQAEYGGKHLPSEVLTGLIKGKIKI